MVARWIERHRKDHWVRRAAAHGYRARSAWKLLHIHERTGLFRSGQCVLELGAAPGGWSQVAKQCVGEHGMLVTVDLIDMKPLPGVHMLRGDFRDAALQEQIYDTLGERKIDLVISDMSPNITGVGVADESAVIELNDAVVRFVREQPACKSCLFKSFQCAELSGRISTWREMFAKLRVVKPESSRATSREVYLLASNARGQALDRAVEGD